MIAAAAVLTVGLSIMAGLFAVELGSWFVVLGGWFVLEGAY